MNDIRNALARARDEWMESYEGKRCQADGAHGQYLRNRLALAFIAGWNARDADAASASEEVA